MKKNYLSAVLILAGFLADAQCRPKICLIDYGYHNDSSPNADMTAIKAALPDILIDNTPGGYWAGGCLPLQYSSLGINVYSYITSGYEGTKYGTSEDNLTANLARVDAIAADGAAGVFLDEVTAFPTTSQRNYITSIYNECQSKGLKLILNPGISNFDTWLMGYDDYLLSDETYNGTRTPSISESPYLSRILVVAESITSAANAAAITQGAKSNGFGHSYACGAYTTLPSWLGNYMALITQTPPATPTITLIGNILHSDAANGNQWYNQNGLISGAVSQNYTPIINGNYYDIVTLLTCSSDTSNSISIVFTGIELVENNKSIRVYPNPAADIVTLNIDNSANEDLKLNIYTVMGVLLKSVTLLQHQQQINVKDLSNGIYLVEIKSKGWSAKQKLIIQR